MSFDKKLEEELEFIDSKFDAYKEGFTHGAGWAKEVLETSQQRGEAPAAADKPKEIIVGCKVRVVPNDTLEEMKKRYNDVGPYWVEGLTDFFGHVGTVVEVVYATTTMRASYPSVAVQFPCGAIWTYMIEDLEVLK